MGWGLRWGVFIDFEDVILFCLFFCFCVGGVIVIMIFFVVFWWWCGL